MEKTTNIAKRPAKFYFKPCPLLEVVSLNCIIHSQTSIKKHGSTIKLERTEKQSINHPLIYFQQKPI